METINRFNQLSARPNLGQTMKLQGLKTASELNCMRIGIIQAFYPETLTADVLITNKKGLGLNQDGTQKVRDFAPIEAKVCYCNPFETFPLQKGDECILLFSDREIESWFINGDVNPEGYTRMHDLTDAVAIVGLRSLPKMIEILSCLHLFFGKSSIALDAGELKIKGTAITIKSDTDITLNAPNVTTTGNLNAGTGLSGVVPCGGATLTFSNGILTGIS